MALVLTEENFNEEVLQAEQLVLVDFWAEWCGPCRSTAPLIDEIEEEFSEQILVGKVNVDDYPALAEEYHVSSIPTIFIFQQGEIVERLVGAHPLEEYQHTLEKYLV